MSLLDEVDDLYASLGYVGSGHEAAAAAAAAHSNACTPDYSMLDTQPHQQPADTQAEEDDGMAFMLKSETEGTATFVAPVLLDPFGLEAPCSPLPPSSLDQQQQQDDLSSDNPTSIFHLKSEMEMSMEMHMSPPPTHMVAAAAAAGHSSPSFRPVPSPLKYESVSNAHLPSRQNATPMPPMMQQQHQPQQQHLSPPRRGAIYVKHEPLSPGVVSSPLSHRSSPTMPALMSSPNTDGSIGVASSPVLPPAAVGRSSSSAGESGSAGSGGSGANSAAHSCASASNSDSDSDGDGASFDDEPAQVVPTTKKGAKAAAAAAAAAAKAAKGGGRKRKAKSGSGNSSSTEQGAANGGVAAVGDEMDDLLAGQVQVIGVGGEPPVENKRQQRLQRNRASAQLSRERKKQYMKLLEKQLKELAELNEGLSVQIRALTSENTSLKTRLSALNMRERVAARYPNGVPQRGNSGPYGGSQASTASMHSSPNHHVAAAAAGAGSDADSVNGGASSNPATPASGSSAETDYPQAKRLKVQAYAAPHSPSSSSGGGSGGRPSGAFNARAGLLLFTVMMGVGLLYNWAGVDMGQVNNNINNNFDLSNSGLTAASIAAAAARGLGRPTTTVPHVATSRATLTLMSEGGGGAGHGTEDQEEDPLVHRAHAALTSTLPTRGRVLASISDNNDDQEANSSSSDAFALVPVHSASGSAAPMDDDSKAIDVYSDRTSGSSSSSRVSVVGDVANDLSSGSAAHLSGKASAADVQLLRRLLLSATSGGNMSASSSSSAAAAAAAGGDTYMFVPQSLSITRDMWTDLLQKHNIVSNDSVGTPSEQAEKQLALFGNNEEEEEASSGARSSSKRNRNGSLKKKKTKGGSVSRLRKVIGLPALPAPGSSTDESMELDSAARVAAVSASSTLLLSELSALPALPSGLQVGDKLLLWVPLQLATSTNGTVADDAEAPKQGLVEIACSIAHVRPIVLS